MTSLATQARAPLAAGTPATPAFRPLAATGRWFWAALSAIGESRGRRELLRLADQYQATRPELARQLRSAARGSWL